MRSYQYTLLGLLLLTPAFAQAQAYLAPEDVLYLNQQSQRLNPRSALRTVQEREANQIDTTSNNRPVFREWWMQSSSSSSPVAPAAAHPSAPVAPAATQTNNQNADPVILHPGANIDPITQRLLLRLQGSGYKDVPVQYVYTRLSHTGPESVAALLAMIPAGIYVVRKARKMEKHLR